MEPERRGGLGVGGVMGICFSVAAIAIMLYGLVQWMLGVPLPMLPVPVIARRSAECRRSCALLGDEYADVTDYGCFCRDDGVVFVVGADSWGACD